MRRVGAVLGVVVIASGATWFAIRAAGRQPSNLGTADTLAVATVVPARPATFADTLLERRLGELVRRFPARCGIMAKHLGTGAVARVNAADPIPLMSVVKLPVAVVVLDGVDHGRWSLDTPIALEPGDMHPRGELGDRWPRGGGAVPLHRLLFLMLARSENSAADALMRIVGGPRAVTEWLERHDLDGVRVDRNERELGNDWYGLPAGADTMGSAEEIREMRAQVPGAVHDSAAAAMLTDPRDIGTAEGCVTLLEQLWAGRLLSPAMTDTLEALLARCATAPNRLPGMLPRGTPVARKTGTGGTTAGVTVAIDDVGVIRLPDGSDVAIAVLLGGPRGTVKRSEALIARVARTVYDAWSTPDGSRSAVNPPDRRSSVREATRTR